MRRHLSKRRLDRSCTCGESLCYESLSRPRADHCYSPSSDDRRRRRRRCDQAAANKRSPRSRRRRQPPPQGRNNNCQCELITKCFQVQSLGFLFNLFRTLRPRLLLDLNWTKPMSTHAHNNNNEKGRGKFVSVRLGRQPPTDWLQTGRQLHATTRTRTKHSRTRTSEKKKK